MDETGGPIVVGSFVEVEGTVAADGSVVAAKIELKIPGECDCNELEFVGFVDSAPGSADGQGAWVIRSGMGLTRTVTADAATQFKSGIPVAGDRVEVHATVQADGSLLASKINKESEGSGGGGGGVEFTALIVSFPAGLVGTWQVGDKTVMAGSQRHGPGRGPSWPARSIWNPTAAAAAALSPSPQQIPIVSFPRRIDLSAGVADPSGGQVGVKTLFRMRGRYCWGHRHCRHGV